MTSHPLSYRRGSGCCPCCTSGVRAARPYLRRVHLCTGAPLRFALLHCFGCVSPWPTGPLINRSTNAGLRPLPTCHLVNVPPRGSAALTFALSLRLFWSTEPLSLRASPCSPHAPVSPCPRAPSRLCRVPTCPLRVSASVPRSLVMRPHPDHLHRLLLRIHLIDQPMLQGDAT